MAKIVIAGKADCPYYAKVEILADSLVKNLPDFKLHKIIKTPAEWETWLMSECSRRGWQHNKSPVVWRELIDRGGKGTLIGGANDFQEYAKAYYDIKSSFTSDDMLKVAAENLQIKAEMDEEERIFKAQSKPTHICLTSAASNTAYGMINEIAKGSVLGETTEIALHLYDSDDNLETLQGLEMESFDLAHPLLREITISSDLRAAFANCSAIVLLDDLEKGEEESKDDWLMRNHTHFVNYATVINEVARKDVKIIVAGNGPVNFNAYMLMQNAPDIPKHNIVAMSRLVENRAKAILAQKLNVNSACVVDIVIWGNPNGTHYVDVTKSRVHNYDGAIWGPPSFSRPVSEMVHDNKWITKEFLEELKVRGETSEAQMNHKATKAMAAAVNTLLGHWWNGSPEGQIFSLGVLSEGDYNIPELVCSVPVTFHHKGYWVPVKGLELDEECKEQLQKAIKDLESEKNVIYPPPKAPTPTPPATPIKETVTLTKNENSTNNSSAGESGEEERSETDEQKTTDESEDGTGVDDEEHPTLEKIVEQKEEEEEAERETGVPPAE